MGIEVLRSLFVVALDKTWKHKTHDHRRRRRRRRRRHHHHHHHHHHDHHHHHHDHYPNHDIISLKTVGVGRRCPFAFHHVHLADSKVQYYSLVFLEKVRDGLYPMVMGVVSYIFPTMVILKLQ